MLHSTFHSAVDFWVDCSAIKQQHDLHAAIVTSLALQLTMSDPSRSDTINYLTRVHNAFEEKRSAWDDELMAMRSDLDKRHGPLDRQAPVLASFVPSSAAAKMESIKDGKTTESLRMQRIKVPRLDQSTFGVNDYLSAVIDNSNKEEGPQERAIRRLWDWEDYTDCLADKSQAAKDKVQSAETALMLLIADKPTGASLSSLVETLKNACFAYKDREHDWIEARRGRYARITDPRHADEVQRLQREEKDVEDVYYALRESCRDAKRRMKAVVSEAGVHDRRS